MKVGDKLLCKKSYYDIKKHKYYTITDIKKLNYFVDYYFYMFESRWYCLDPNDIWYIWNYFYTPQELRKMKLKQLIK